MTSPPFRVPRARHVGRLTEFLTNLTEPSPKSTFTPPGWRLDGGTCIDMFTMPVLGNPAHVLWFGVEVWLYVVQHMSASDQEIP